ncbi:swi5-dependent recombination DNA repair protein 1 homolog [Fagus crenata]
MSALQLRPKHRTLHNPSSFIHLFSTTPDHDHDQSSSDVKATLKSKPFTPLNQSFSRPSKAHSLEEIHKNLSEFRTRSSVPPPSTNPISFQELYNKRNAMAKADNDNATTAKFSFDAIRQSLNAIKMTTGPSQNDRRSGDPMSLSAFKSSLKLKPAPDLVIGGTDSQHFSVFAKERERKEGETETMAMKTEFVKMYGYEELGMKLRKLRPSVEEGNKEGEEALCFSLSELNDRLMKLREMEEKETELSIAGLPYKDLRETLVMMTMSENEKAKRNSS